MSKNRHWPASLPLARGDESQNELTDKNIKSQTLVRGDKTQGEKNMQKHNWKINIVNEWTGEKRCFRYNGTVDETKDFLLKFAYRLAGKLRPTLTPRRIGSDFNSCQSVSR